MTCFPNEIDELSLYAFSPGKLCCIQESELTESQPSIQGLFDIIHPSCEKNPNQIEVRFPSLLQGMKVLFIGNNVAADSFYLSFFIGPDGFLDVFEVNKQTCEMCETLIDFHMDAFQFDTPNIAFYTGSFTDFTNRPDKTDYYDVVVATTQFCFGPHKNSAMINIHNILKLGGECYFRETFSNKQLTKEATDSFNLIHEGIASPLAWEDFVVDAMDIGFCQPRLIESRPLTILNDEFKEYIETNKIKLISAIFHMFKIPIDDSTNCYLVTYNGGIVGFDEMISFDNTLSFKKNEIVSIGTSVGTIFQLSRYKPYFSFQIYDRKKSGLIENVDQMENVQLQSEMFQSEDAISEPDDCEMYRKDSMRTSFRNGERYFVNDDRNPARTAKPRIRRRSTRTRYSQGGDQSDHQNQQPEANRNENQASKDDTGRRRGSSRRRRRRTNSSIAAASGQPGTANKPAIRSASVNGGAGNSAANRNRKFVCNVCKQSFRTDSLRLRHLRLFHPRRRDFVCKECRGVFPTAKSITTHLSTPHQEERLPIAEVRRRAKPGIPIRYVPDGLPIFSCKYCPFGFLTANDAESHQTRCRASQRLSINMDLEYPGNDQYVIYCFCCPELLSVHQNMKEHFKCLHNFVDLSISYHCSICKSGKFDSEAEAADHFKQAHTDKHLEEFRNKRKDEYIEESLKSYQMQRPVSMLRVKAEVRQVMNKLLRQVSATLKASPPS
ncbi:hypothetical protein GJ496_003395 [Pomphorhynchus laevis]|nr:hypothetical protein GJ496_003395 [Pomphorhynchus laevis]